MHMLLLNDLENKLKITILEIRKQLIHDPSKEK